MPVVRKGAATAAPAVASAQPVEDESQLAVAGNDPDLFAEGGLRDDFDGTILKARYAPWDYMGELDHHVLAVALTIKPDEDDEPFVQYYSAGDLEHFVPSNDGKTSVPLDSETATPEQLEGIYALRVGKREQLANSSNWATFVQNLIEAKFPKDRLKAAVSFVEGTYGHFNRIPQKKRSGIVAAPAKEGKTRRNDILVMTEIKGFVKPGAAATPAQGAAPKAPPAKPVPPAKPAASAAATPAPAGDLIARVTEVVSTAVTEAGEAGLEKAALAQLMVSSFSGADKAKAVKMIGDVKFLGSDDAPWAYDADTGTLYAL